MSVFSSQDHVKLKPLTTRTAKKVPIANEKMQGNDEAKASVLETDGIYRHYKPVLRLLSIRKTITGACGFDLTRTKWDPYPWVNAVDAHTAAEMSGLKAGDCVLEVNGEDVLGLRITDIAKLVQAKSGHVTLLLWSCGSDFKCDPESICCAPMPRTLQRLATIVQSILAIIECPVCLDTIAPPVMQCQNGHLLCLNCRIRAEKCPICRDRYTPQRALIAEQIYAAITSAYNLCNANEDKLRQKLFGGVHGRAEKEASVRVVNSRRMRRDEAAKQTIENDQPTEAGEEQRLQMKKRWRCQKQTRREQCQSLDAVVSGDAGQTGRFSYIRDADTDADVAAMAGATNAGVTDVTDVSAAKHETKRKKILMKLWNGTAAVCIENCNSTGGEAERIKPIKSGQENSRVIDMRRDGNELDGEVKPVIEAQIMAGLHTQVLQYFSNRNDSKKANSRRGECGTQILQNPATLRDEQNYSDSTRNNEDTEEEAITTATKTIPTVLSMKMQTTQMQMRPLTMPLKCAPTNKTILNDAATNNVAHVNVMSKLLVSPTVAATINDLPATLPPPQRSPRSQTACKNNETAVETVMNNWKVVPEQQQHVQPQWQLTVWQQGQQEQHLTGLNKCDDSILASTSTFTTIACGCCTQQQRHHLRECNGSFVNCSYSSSSSLPLEEDKRRYAVHIQSCSAEYSNKCSWPEAETTSLPPADLKKYCSCNNATGCCSTSARKSLKSGEDAIHNSCCIIDSSHLFNSTPASSQSSGICLQLNGPKRLRYDKSTV